MPTCPHVSPWFGRVSALLGWTYFCAWSVSFYPQLYMNWRRKSVEGLSVDFVVYNVLGFSCYSIYNVALYGNSRILEEYTAATGSDSTGVERNDVFFATHAFIMSLLLALQCLYFGRLHLRISGTCILITSTCVFVIIGYALALCYCGEGESYGQTWLSWLYLLSYVKMLTTLIKYIPQVILNHVRKSTVGWNIHNVLLDSTGGLLSITQSVVDSIGKNDWETITGNPVKTGLGLISLIFDGVFVLQHYILFPEPPALPILKVEKFTTPETQPLLDPMEKTASYDTTAGLDAQSNEEQQPLLQTVAYV